MPDEPRHTDDPDAGRNAEIQPPDGETPPEAGYGLLEAMNNYLLLIYAGACLLMNYSVAGILYIKGMTHLSLIVPGVVAILVPLYLLSRRSAAGFVREFSLGAPAASIMLAAVAVALSSILPIEAFSGLFERMRPPDADYISFILSIKPKGPGAFALTALGIAVIGPFAEELLFRGFVQRILARNMSGALAVTLSKILFGLSHFSLAILPGVAALGILYGYLYHSTRSLWCPFVAHAAFNLWSLLRLHSAAEEEIVSAGVELPSLAWTLVSLAAFVLSLAILSRLARGRGGTR